jgi:hypothetical protein
VKKGLRRASPFFTIEGRRFLLKSSPPNELARQRCRVGGINQNYTSSAGTLYHIQVEDLGPVVDRVTETEVRRVNVIVYANYGEPNARIIHGRDYDFPDLRTHEHNEAIQGRIPELAAAAREVIEEKEGKLVARIKSLIREYHRAKTETAKRAFEQANAFHPFLFSRAWSELKREKAAAEPAPPVASTLVPEIAVPDEVLYPLDAALRARVIDIERLIHEIARDLERLKAAGKADDILIQTCRKLTLRAREALAGPHAPEFTARRLDMTRNSLTTTWRQIQSRLK